MTFVSCIGHCVSCNRLFSFNPERVPSLRLYPDGEREPVCLDCFNLINQARVAQGKSANVLTPGAYTAEEA